MSLESVIQAAKESRQATADATPAASLDELPAVTPGATVAAGDPEAKPAGDDVAAASGAATGSQAVDACMDYDKLIEQKTADIKKLDSRKKNLTRSDPRLDGARTKRVAAKELTREEAVKEALTEVNKALATEVRALAKLQHDQKQASSVEQIKKDTDLLPGMKLKIDNMDEKVNRIDAVLCEGKLCVPLEMPASNGVRAIRYAKATLTNKFQAYTKSPDSTVGEVNEVLECKLAASFAEEQRVKQARDDHKVAKDRHAKLDLEMKKLRADLHLAKVQNKKAEESRLVRKIKTLAPDLTTATKQAAELKKALDEIRPKKQPSKISDSTLKQLEANFAADKEAEAKATEIWKKAKQDLESATRILGNKTHAAKVARGENATPALQEKSEAVAKKKQCQEALALANSNKLTAQLACKEAAAQIEHYKKTGELPEQTQAQDEKEEDEKEGDEKEGDEQEEEFEEDDAVEPGEAPCPTAAAADSSAAPSKRSHKRKADQVDMSDLPPGATRNEKSKLAKARAAPNQGKLQQNAPEEQGKCVQNNGGDVVR